jgi:hypothetical protein
MEAVGSSLTISHYMVQRPENCNLRSRHYVNLRFCLICLIVLDILYVQFLV